ncbi:MAG TPA: hypothetical protein VFJ85_00475 [Acidimicrobiales bacterium]|nr:hypothetical protein [Acidimicrobiales bacterium]
MKTRAVFVGVWVVAALALAACSKGGEALTRAGYVAKGSAICTKVQKSIDDGATTAFPDKGKVPTADQVAVFVKDTVKPQLRQELSQLDQLNPPKEDRSRVNDILAAGRRGLTTVDDTPVALLEGTTNPLNDYTELSKAYGLKGCGPSGETTTRRLAGLQ